MSKLVTLGTVSSETRHIFFRSIKDGGKALNTSLNKWCYLSDQEVGVYVDAPLN